MWARLKVKCFQLKWKRVSKGCENVERKWLQTALKIKYNCWKWHLNPSALQAGMWLGQQSFAFWTLPVCSSWCAKWSSVIQITLKIVVHQHETQVVVKIHRPTVSGTLLFVPFNELNSISCSFLWHYKHVYMRVGVHSCECINSVKYTIPKSDKWLLFLCFFFQIPYSNFACQHLCFWLKLHCWFDWFGWYW